MTETSKSVLPGALAKGYTKFREFEYTRSADHYLQLADGQKPETMIIACCDSRAAPETIFDAGAGELFVVRNVANLVPPYAPDAGRHSTSAALEFAVIALGVKQIVVMGHSQCGGIKAAVTNIDPLSKGDFITKWMDDVKDVVDGVPAPENGDTHAHCQMVEQASVEQSLHNLRSFPWIAQRCRSGELSLHGAWFDIASAELHVFDDKTNEWVKANG